MAFKQYALGLFTLIIFGLLSWSVIAQDSASDDCPALVEQAMIAMGENCSVTGLDNACYGYNQVDSSFHQDVEDNFFASPSDTAELRIIDSIQTSGLDIDTDRWGVAVLNVQANVPSVLPGQAVTFILVGDSEIINDVEPDAVIDSPEAITVTASTRANVRSGASTNTNVVGVVEAGDTLLADALSDDGAWIRVGFEDRVAWMNLDVLASIEGVDSLPFASDPVLSPMQAFYFRTGVGELSCNEAPDVIGVRSPDNLRVDLSVNGASISVGSLIMLKQTATDEFVITVREGSVITEDGQVIEAGQSIDVILDEEGNIVGWGEVRPATEEELGYGEVMYNAFDILGLVDLEPTISIPSVINNPVSVGCAGFQPTSPLTGLGYGQNIFYWDAAQGATSYRVTVTNLTENRSLSFDTVGAETNLVGNLTNENIGFGYDFSWEVQALRNGNVICSQPPVTIQRGAEPVSAEQPFNASWGCADPGSALIAINWSNAPDPNDIHIRFWWVEGFIDIYTSGSSGVEYFDGYGDVLDQGTITSGGVTTPIIPAAIDSYACETQQP